MCLLSCTYPGISGTSYVKGTTPVSIINFEEENLVKKFLAIMLALTLALGLLAGCGGGNEGGDQGGADGKVTLSIGMPADAMVIDPSSGNALTKWVEEQLGVKLKFTIYPGGTDVATQVTTTVFANQELPDILIGIPLETDTIADFGHDGYLVDLSEYFADKEGASKNFWERIAVLTENEQQYIVEKMTDNDTGEIYTVPSVEYSLIDQIYYQTWINVEWLDQLQMEKPTNAEELYQFLKAVDNTDLTGNGDTEDEIPLFGSQKSVYGTRVLDWIINMFTYYHTQHKWQPDADGKMYHTMTTDAYREGMAFAAKLYKEGLLTNMIYTTGDGDMKMIATPSSGQAQCGIFAGHLSVHAQLENEVLYQYEPLQNWGTCATKDINCNTKAFITADCDNVDKAFELMMLLWSEEGSMRQRYGEKGVDWDDPDEGAKSLMGLDATYKLNRDVLMEQTNANWGAMVGFNYYAEGETAQTPDDATEWVKTKNAMHAESYKLWVETAEKNNPEQLCPIMFHTTEEEEATESVRTNINTYLGECEKNFLTGTLDINDDAVWQEFLDTLDEMGMDTYQKYVQDAYDRS